MSPTCRTEGEFRPAQHEASPVSVHKHAPGARAAIAAVLLALAGCANMPAGDVAPADPWERWNRQTFSFNELVDQVAIKPAALTYQALVPRVVRVGVDNVFGNVGDAWTTANLLLQAKPRHALDMGFRTLTNSVLGVVGLFDVADELGMERTANEDFGQTLGFWGIKTGPYLVLPLLGPSTLRDTSARFLDFNSSANHVLWAESRDRNGATVLQVLSTRVYLLNAGRVLDDIALDKYLLLRDAYLARRRSQIYDGEPPDDDSKATAPYKQLIK